MEVSSSLLTVQAVLAEASKAQQFQRKFYKGNFSLKGKLKTKTGAEIWKGMVGSSFGHCLLPLLTLGLRFGYILSQYQSGT